MGNRTQTANGGIISYTSNNLNQYTQVGAAVYSYDANGNLTSDGTNTYAYDYENRLVSASKAGMSATYTYDPFVRRIEKNVDGTITNFIYDGDQVIAEYDGSDILLRKFAYGPGIDEPILMNDGTKQYYYHFDALGSVTEITDSTATVVEKYTYDVFGEASIKDKDDNILTKSTIGNPYAFTGRRFDPESGLYYYRARYYNPRVGRFLSEDPVGYIDGINLYRYVGNNPINFTDPFGWCKDATWWEKGWDWWSDLVAPGEGGVIPAKPGESWEEYFERFKKDRFYEFAASEALGIAGGWTSLGSTAMHVSLSESLRLTGSELGNRFVSIGGKGFWYMKGVPRAMKWRQVASGAAKGSAITWVITSGATGYRVGLQLDAWLSYTLTKRQ